MFFHLLQRRSTFLIGFGIGFFLAFLFYFVGSFVNDGTIYNEKKWQYQQYSDDLSILWMTPANLFSRGLKFRNWVKSNWTKGLQNVSYDKWFAMHNLQVNAIDMDRYLYAPDTSQKVMTLESDWLKSKVFITCIIFVEKVKLARSIKDTWGSRCNQIYFFGQHVKDSGIPIINFTIKFKSSWHFLCEVMNYVWKDNEIKQWIIFVKDDIMVIPENLRYIVAPLSYEENYYLGHAVVMWGQPYNVAQAGYVLSKGSLEKVMEMFNTSQKCAAGGKFWKKEDYYLGKHLLSMGILPVDTRDEYLRGTFHGYALHSLLWGIAKPGSYWTHALYPPQKECCSPMSVTFNAAEADKMFTFNYLLYHLNVFTKKGIFGNKHAPMSFPEEDVWKIALKEEFNITNLNEISSDAYYEIWHSKYSEPEQLILKNYPNTSNVLSSILTAYESKNQVSDKLSLK
ncbi:hypothetical protein KPH14_010371 [Odynerus spinipes]|uniref:Uncharacterized protein n=1 Tax=Odynerus spinipes TaxID=1348599 RepID=A0AAD9RTP9_9HYME|nr:hypothetical protein KPH14_010371 [Odynerus spinipes]